jgi:methionine synthase I (cobalamin-dependent)/5,10-methylenetetrahydrofolate reductase
MSRFLDELRKGLMLGDGALGTLFYHRGEPLQVCYDALNLRKPDVVRQAHQDYLDAGARLIETNTFGANCFKLEKFGLEDQVQAINETGARLAREVAHAQGAYAAGSVGPLLANSAAALDDDQKIRAYQEQIRSLIRGGVDALFLETFSSLAELLLALRVAREIDRLPVIASLSFSDDGHTADGSRIGEAFSQLKAAGADVVGLNCHMGPGGIEKLLHEVSIQSGELVSAYPNAGRPQFYEGRYVYHPTPQYFADYLPKLVAQGARLIGGCCGTTPDTIRAMAQVAGNRTPVVQKQGAPAVEVVHPPVSAPPSEAGGLLEVARRRTLIVTELDPPKTLHLDKMLEGARALKQAGTDYLTLADNSLAILRVSNVAAAHLVHRQTALEPIVHLACRDRNLIGLQSELMGLHALGLHHVLALTGDPAKMGDHPGATSVYDVNSIGLIKVLQRMNEGFAVNGRDLKAKTQFVIGCAFNPNARNLDSQTRKLEDKLRAGAQFVMTQPIFDPALVKATFERTRGFGVPILLGVMPLLNQRNAEFLHNEVPGITIPDPIRERLRGKDGPDGHEEGLRIANELCEAILESFTGIYLITPWMRFDLTARLSRFIRDQARQNSGVSS